MPRTEVILKNRKTVPGIQKQSTLRKDALDELIDEFVDGRPDRQAMFEEATASIEAAQLVYDLRKRTGLTQRELAKKVGTTASVICRMEQADYEGSLAMLRRIATALNRRIELRAVPLKGITKRTPRRMAKAD